MGNGRVLFREDTRFWSLIGKVLAFKDVDLGAGDAASIHGFDVQRRAEVHGGCCILKDAGVDPGVNQGSEKHVSGDAGEAVEIGDAHAGLS